MIALTGTKYSGKDTVGEFLIHKYNYKRYAFADPLKNLCKVLFKLNNEELNGKDKETYNPRLKSTPRKILQTVGEYFRKHYPDIWISILNDKIHHKKNKYVVTDLRYDDEAEYLKSKGFIIIKLMRDTGYKDDHSSESGIDNKYYDFIIENNSSKNDLYKKIDNIINVAPQIHN